MAANTDLDAFKKDQTVTTIDTSRKVRVAIIGTGWIAGSHMASLLNQPDVEVVAGADLVPGKAKAFFEKFKSEKFDPSTVKTDYANDEEMIADKSLNLDAVCVCTYNRQHAPCAIDALDAGVNVIVEKPLCVTLEEGIEMMKAEKRSGKILSIGFQPRFNDNMKEIKKIVESGELGDIYYIQTGGGRRRGIPIGHECSFIRDDTAGLGALGDIGCYSLDMVLYAIGYPKPLTVTGYKSAFFGQSPEHYASHKLSYGGVYYDESLAKVFTVDDFAAAFVRLEGGIILDFRIAWAMNIDSPGDTIILGTKGGLRIPATDCWNGSIGGPMTIYKEVAGTQVETTIPMFPDGNLWQGKIRSFLDAVKTGGKAPIPISQIIYNQAILDGILRSSNEGKEVTIEIPEV